MKWDKVLQIDLISSDESDGEVISVKDMQWRSGTVTSFFRMLDEGAENKKSEQAKRQTKERVLVGISSHPKPASGRLPSWAVNQ